MGTEDGIPWLLLSSLEIQRPQLFLLWITAATLSPDLPSGVHNSTLTYPPGSTELSASPEVRPCTSLPKNFPRFPKSLSKELTRPCPTCLPYFLFGCIPCNSFSSLPGSRKPMMFLFLECFRYIPSSSPLHLPFPLPTTPIVRRPHGSLHHQLQVCSNSYSQYGLSDTPIFHALLLASPIHFSILFSS